ncbi:hypothetical protein HO173_005821 [Letharia columbiana]|uniref:Uncharacterized protein n=1 Tax=Letharia columbiana TaxID=112416 RepID=A0A8H6FWV3_9LECA|nr:uncharacterized protein HO173_005821 [Letharia columbiana]KAF6236192.1 hypothetical protein HO173_005821 [Letharia columbiana]
MSTTHIVSLLPNGIQHIRFFTSHETPRIGKCLSYGSGLCQSGHWLLSTRYGSLGRVHGTGSLGRVGLRGTGSRSGYVGSAVEAVGLQSGWMQWTTTKQDSYKLRQRMQWIFDGKGMGDTGQIYSEAPRPGCQKVLEVNACVGVSSILKKDYGKKDYGKKTGQGEELGESCWYAGKMWLHLQDL